MYEAAVDLSVAVGLRQEVRRYSQESATMITWTWGWRDAQMLSQALSVFDATRPKIWQIRYLVQLEEMAFNITLGAVSQIQKIQGGFGLISEQSRRLRI